MASDSPNTPTRTHCFFITALSCAALGEPTIAGSRLSSTLYRDPPCQRCLLFMSKEGARRGSGGGFTTGFKFTCCLRQPAFGKPTVRGDVYRLPITILPEKDVRSRIAPPSP